MTKRRCQVVAKQKEAEPQDRESNCEPPNDEGISLWLAGLLVECVCLLGADKLLFSGFSVCRQILQS